MQLTTEEVDVMGDTAWEVGTGTFDTNQGPVNAKYVVIFGSRRPTAGGGTATSGT